MHNWLILNNFSADSIFLHCWVGVGKLIGWVSDRRLAGTPGRPGLPWTGSDWDLHVAGYSSTQCPVCMPCCGGTGIQYFDTGTVVAGGGIGFGIGLDIGVDIGTSTVVPAAGLTNLCVPSTWGLWFRIWMCVIGGGESEKVKESKLWIDLGESLVGANCVSVCGGRLVPPCGRTVLDKLQCGSVQNRRSNERKYWNNICHTFNTH